MADLIRELWPVVAAAAFILVAALVAWRGPGWARVLLGMRDEGV